MTDVLKELVSLAEKATPGPWRNLRYAIFGPCTTKGRDGDIAVSHNNRPNALDDANFISAARNAIPALKSLLSQEAELRELIENIRLQPEPMTPTISEFQRGHNGFVGHALWQGEQNVAYRLEALIRRHHES